MKKMGENQVFKMTNMDQYKMMNMEKHNKFFKEFFFNLVTNEVYKSKRNKHHIV